MATTTENLGLTLPAGTDRALVSDLNENFQTLDAFAGQATADIQQAQETADAAAPQATTYTKDEVDAAIEEAIEHGGGGTTDYTELTNKPSINGVVLTGNKTTSDLGIEENVQADWDEADTTAPSYIKNKPNIPAGVVVDTTYDGTSENAQAGTAVAQAISTKVDKVTGKGLSTNDFTNADKTKLNGIETGAEANVQADWTQTDTTADDYIKNKPTIPAPVTVDQTYSAASANAQSGVAVAQAISTKVDKETGKGLSTNDFTNTDKANLATALATANAAAPQSTTYTKTEVDTAMAAKLDISDVDSALSSTSTNPVQNKVVQAPIARLVDAEAKNLLKNERNSGATVINNGATWVFSKGTMEAIVSGTVGTTWSDVSILNATIDLSDKEYIVVVQSDAETMFAYLPGNTITGGNIPTNSQYYPGTYRFKGIIAANARFTARTGSLNNNFLRVMICTAEDYAISSEFVPYAKSNYELTQDVEPIPRLVDSGAKNLLKITATSQTINGVTFTVNADQTVTVNGTNTGTGAATFILVPNQQAIQIPDGDYWFSGCPQGGGTDTFDLRWYRYSSNVSAYDRGSGAAIHKSGNTTASNIAIVVMVGVTANNITFKPMLCTPEDYAISPEFVPYTPTMRELYEMLLALQNGG